MQLRALLQHVPALTVEGPSDREFVGLAYDSRRVTPGMVFFAIPGLNTDGHDFIADAIERGAVAVVCQRNGFVPRRATKIKVADTRMALALAAAAFYGHPSRKLKVIGVTGTNGKTCVAFMLRAMLEAAGVQPGLISTIRHEIGDRVIPAQRTTPEALEIQQMLAAMVRSGCGACVMEVSSHALDQQRVAGVEFDLGIFTNLTEDHLDYHASVEDYYQAKKRLFDGIAAGAKRGGGAVINIDDAYGARLARETTVEVQLTYGLGDAARVRARNLVLSRQGARMTVEGPHGSFDCQLPLIGRNNVFNALAATGAALFLRLPPAVIRGALNTLQPVPGRLERVVQGQPFDVFVDYAHTEAALRQTLETLREVTAGRLLLTFGCGGSRDTAKRSRMGRVAAELATFTVITNDNPRRETPEEIAAQIETGYCDVRADGCTVELDRRRAIAGLLRVARPGDTLLIAGKGHETYQEFEDTVVPFDDRVYVRETLGNLGFPPRPGDPS
ncbi:MAG: UDP-N-acetylmuramoyl-L-alanyl-D-glutamate--2,6-diaminopimelate ligase [Verrucomicrobiota bacterium]|jgi:UDP-N-acetylmuramoyl-L-alanyl-D-glutamate--2,6-diaminopimelate ligase